MNNIPYGRVNLVYDHLSQKRYIQVGGYGQREVSEYTFQHINSPDPRRMEQGIIFLMEEVVKIMEEDGSVKPGDYYDPYRVDPYSF